MHNFFWHESQNALLKSAIHSYKNDGTPRRSRELEQKLSTTQKKLTHTNIRTENSEPLH